MTAAFAEVIIAIHDPSRPIERAVASVFDGRAQSPDLRATVVCHGIEPGPIAERLHPWASGVEVVAHVDGIRSAAGPFNAGLARSTAEYVAVMGSDDFWERGALDALMAQARRWRPSAVLAPIREQNGAILLNPLARLWRVHRLDPAKDRMFYRTAPLGLVRRERVDALGLRFEDGVRVSEDLEFGVRLWTTGGRVDFARYAPCYVVGNDAGQRTTLAPLSVEESLEAHRRLLDRGDLLAALPTATRRALAVKMARISVLGIARARRDPAAWRGDDEVAFLGEILRRLLRLAPGVLGPFSLQERRVLDGLLADPRVGRVVADVAWSEAASRPARVMTKNPLRMFARESVLRRYALYAVQRAPRNRHA